MLHCILACCCLFRWSITYGMGLLGGLAMTSGMIMNTMYRQKLRLLPHGRVSSYLPLVILPSACSMLLHHMCVTQEVVLMENQCPVCHEVRAASIQTLTGWAMPFSLTLLSSLALARTKHTIHVPNMRDIPALTKFLQKTLKPLGLTLTVLLALNIMVPVWVTQQQLKAAPKVWERVGFKTDEHANEVVDSWVYEKML